MTKIDKYFEKCIKDAHISEQREFNPDRVSWFYVVVNDQILFNINTPYRRVTSKALYRVQNNIEKNFGLKVKEEFTKDGYFLDTVLQVNHVCNRITVGKHHFFICKKISLEDAEKGEVIPAGRYEKLIKAYYNISIDQYKENPDNYHLPYDIKWEEYREVYFKAYGEYPEIEIRECSSFVTLS